MATLCESQIVTRFCSHCRNYGCEVISNPDGPETLNEFNCIKRNGPKNFEDLLRKADAHKGTCPTFAQAISIPHHPAQTGISVEQAQVVLKCQSCASKPNNPLDYRNCSQRSDHQIIKEAARENCRFYT